MKVEPSRRLPQIIRLQVPGDLHHRDVALRTIAAACRVAAPPDDDGGGAKTVLEHVLSAVGEAFNNIALHGYRDHPPGVIEIEISFDSRALAIEMRDYGRSYDPRAAPRPDLAALPESGLGAFIISSFMDQVDYAPGRPNVLKLVKRLA